MPPCHTKMSCVPCTLPTSSSEFSDQDHCRQSYGKKPAHAARFACRSSVQTHWARAHMCRRNRRGRERQTMHARNRDQVAYVARARGPKIAGVTRARRFALPPHLRPQVPNSGTHFRYCVVTTSQDPLPPPLSNFFQPISNINSFLSLSQPVVFHF